RHFRAGPPRQRVVPAPGPPRRQVLRRPLGDARRHGPHVRRLHDAHRGPAPAGQQRHRRPRPGDAGRSPPPRRGAGEVPRCPVGVRPAAPPPRGGVRATPRGAGSGLRAVASRREFIRDAGANAFPGQGAGFLGKAYAPLLVEADAARRGFRPPEVVLPPDVTADRLAARGFLRRQLDRALAGAPAPDDMEEWQRQAVGLLRSPGLRRAFEIDREPDRVRASYGRHLFGQGCLLARRLLEAGVAFVTVYWHYEGPDDSPVWDTHGNNFTHLRQRLMPPTDQALAALLADLGQPGLLDDTLVVCLGEFGRTPRINKNAGRDHWPHVQSVGLAGAGVRGGSVYGASDRHGAYPADQPVTPADLVATVLHLLGVPPDLGLIDRLGRPLRACSG